MVTRHLRHWAQSLSLQDLGGVMDIWAVLIFRISQAVVALAVPLVGTARQVVEDPTLPEVVTVMMGITLFTSHSV